MSQADIERLLVEQRPWIERQRQRQVPRLGLERLAVSESEARIAAREIVSALAEEEADEFGVAYRKIRIGTQRTLWGSCSPRGVLSFNWRLVLAPFEVLDYVVVHELCHLRVLDHSRRFWKPSRSACALPRQPQRLAPRCRQCGGELQSRRSRYCSPSCKKRAYRQRQHI